MQTSSYAGVVSMVAQGSPKPLDWVQILAPVPKKLIRLNQFF